MEFIMKNLIMGRAELALNQNLQAWARHCLDYLSHTLGRLVKLESRKSLQEREKIGL
jgi:hypothetical protein